VWLVPELAKENGVADRVTVHATSSLEMEAPEPIDVVISDMRGAAPLVDQNLAALRDIRERWLAPGGVVIPLRDRLQVVVVEAEGVGGWLERAATSFERLGFQAASARSSIRNQVYGDSSHPLASSDMLSSNGTWATIEYGSGDYQSVEGTVSLEAKRGGLARGLSVYFETDLCPGVGFDTAPGQSVVYGRLFLPLATWLDVAPEDRFEVTVRADVRGERWAWDTTHLRGGEPVAKLRQATFLGLPSSMADLVRTSETSAPKLGKRGERLRRILGEMDGTRTIRQIADDVASAKDGSRVTDALELVRSVAMRYGA
jgi:protein arginine N-methyltransferase 1